MTHHSEPRLLALHAVRVLGFADTPVIAEHAALTLGDATDLLQEAEHHGWVQHSSFADLAGWSLTDEGKAENERLLAAERDIVDPDGRITGAYQAFLPLNARLLRAVTDWQLAPTTADALAPNDHSDKDRDGGILIELGALNQALAPLVATLSEVLARFDGYAERFDAALNKAKEGHHQWIDRMDVDSCHRVWFQLHEDLIATLGIDRGGENITRTA